MPTEKAHGLQIAKMCEAYAKLGHDIELIVPYRRNHIAETVHGYYGLATSFPVHTISIPDTILFSKWIPSIAYWLQAVFFLGALTLKNKIPKDTLIMTRSADVAWWYTLRGYTVVCEVHEWPRTRAWFSSYLLRSVKYLVTNSKGLAEEIKTHGLSAFVAPNGVDLDALKPTIGRDEMCKQNNIDESSFVSMYIGALEDWKGYETFLKASKKLQDVVTVIVGGKDEHIEELRKEYPYVCFFGTRPYREIGNYQNMADVLVIPNDPRFTEAQKYTSPIKLFAHLTSGVPIVVTDLPTMRDIVCEEEVFFFDGSEDSLAQVISEVQNNQAESEHRAENAKALAQKYTWSMRAQNILEMYSIENRVV
jgi:glycosyltransferase involved in cell wall biosynthesis